MRWRSRLSALRLRLGGRSPFPRGDLNAAELALIASLFSPEERRGLRKSSWEVAQISRIARRMLATGHEELARRWVGGLGEGLRGFSPLTTLEVLDLDHRPRGAGFVEECGPEALVAVLWSLDPSLSTEEEVDLVAADGARLAARLQDSEGLDTLRRWFGIHAAAFRARPEFEEARFAVRLHGRLLRAQPRLEAVPREPLDPERLVDEVRAACGGEGGIPVKLVDLGLGGATLLGAEDLQEGEVRFLYLPLLIVDDPSLLFVRGRVVPTGGRGSRPFLRFDPLPRSTRELVLRLRVAATRKPPLRMVSLLPV